ncbi:tropomyosin [Armillaria novae-zelandiae]|uniref:Tropomyosin n=1 Tax=Armillaria novae-zelandiae TaxID=153914 RepID=A0AA39UR12_9AGAR|nr:tropomyosin [Armillaria novae-zelandiae]
MTDKIREKMNNLRIEADNAVTRAEEAEAKNKKYEQALLEKDQEITSLQHKLALLDADLEKAEGKVQEYKLAQEEGEHSKSTNDSLQRKVQLLEEELDVAEKNVKDTVEKLRQVDVKAEHFERQVSRVEQERDMWEKRWEEAQAKYNASKKELDELAQVLEGI